MSSQKKKNILISIVLIALLVLVACNPNKSSETNGKDSDGNVKLEILSWWTAGGEADALSAVLEGFSARNPSIIVENAAVAGGGGANSQAVLSTRLQGGILQRYFKPRVEQTYYVGKQRDI